MSRRDLRTSEQEWRSTANRAAVAVNRAATARVIRFRHIAAGIVVAASAYLLVTGLAEKVMG